MPGTQWDSASVPVLLSVHDCFAIEESKCCRQSGSICGSLRHGASPAGPGCSRAFRSEKGLPTRVAVHILLTFLTSLSLCRQARPGLEVVHVWGLAAAPRDALVAGWQAARGTEPKFEYSDGGIRFAAHRWLPAATEVVVIQPLFPAWSQMGLQPACVNGKILL